MAVENYPDLAAHREIADAMQQNMYLQREITAARESVNSGLAATFEANKAEIEKAINSIDSQILYLKALKEQDNNKIEEVTTNKNGIAQTSELEKGLYYIKEI